MSLPFFTPDEENEAVPCENSDGEPLLGIETTKERIVLYFRNQSNIEAMMAQARSYGYKGAKVTRELLESPIYFNSHGQWDSGRYGSGFRVITVCRGEVGLQFCL